MLDLLTEDESLLLILVCQPVIVFHLGLLLLYLHHVVQICNFHLKELAFLSLLAPPITIASTSLPCDILALGRTIYGLNFGLVNGLLNKLRLGLGVWLS